MASSWMNIRELKEKRQAENGQVQGARFILLDLLME